MVWYNHQSKVLDPQVMARKLSPLRAQADIIDGDIRESLRVAKQDIFILGTTQRDTNHIVKTYVGPEFLLASLLENVQSSTFIKGTARKLDIVKHYERCTEALHLKIQRDPSRERFLEIAALKDNLAALASVKRTQCNLLRAWDITLAPLSFSYATTKWTFREMRSVMFNFEGPYIMEQVKKSHSTSDGLSDLSNRASVLQLDASTNLEILEEGHGKAIRVFTIVTIFFLPL